MLGKFKKKRVNAFKKCNNYYSTFFEKLYTLSKVLKTL